MLIIVVIVHQNKNNQDSMIVIIKLTKKKRKWINVMGDIHSNFSAIKQKKEIKIQKVQDSKRKEGNYVINHESE